ncbi:MAG: HlyC/CorC family transporter [Betaproteobacteria bacterium]|nr:HlyC/CorC family transporter [Betaproteobacteria bacterium]
MEEVPLSAEFAALAVLLVVSAFFSIAETSMMALNRYRLKHLVAQGHGGARRAAQLLQRIDRLLSAILIGNTLANAGATTLAGVIAVRFLGQDKLAYAVSTLVVSFLIVVLCEITPKVIGATYPERISLPLAWVLGPLQRMLAPAVWFANLFARPLLWLAGVRAGGAEESAPTLTPEEIRTLVLESSNFMPKKHVSILLNLFDLGNVTVQDIMVPRARIESLKMDDDPDTIARQLVTSYHMRLPVFRDSLGDVIGVLHVKKVLGLLLQSSRLDKHALEALVAEPYFVPASTPVLSQMQYFQENRERIALVVDEYGELMGLVTLEDIIEEIIGKFTTSLPAPGPALHWGADGSASADGALPVREINRALGLNLPTDGPKTLNGLILEHLQEIPEADVSIKIAGVPMEIVHAQGRTVKTVRVFRPSEAGAPEEVLP